MTSEVVDLVDEVGDLCREVATQTLHLKVPNICTPARAVGCEVEKVDNELQSWKVFHESEGLSITSPTAQLENVDVLELALVLEELGSVLDL